MRIAGLVLLLVVLAPVHLATKLLFGSSDWPPRFLASAAWIIGARVRRIGAALHRTGLIVANHVSWLDILVLGGATGCVFVSKAQLGHPLVHWLADQNGTIYVDRNARREAGEQAARVTRALGGGELIALFPEGTVGPGDRLLPFRAPLLAAASDGAYPVQPVVLDYHGAAPEISWFEQDGRDNVIRLLGRRGTLPVDVNVLEPLAPGDRKQLAAEARAQIAAVLGFKSDAQSPIGEKT